MVGGGRLFCPIGVISFLSFYLEFDISRKLSMDDAQEARG